jgi:CRP-like cAMP-binding protein
MHEFINEFRCLDCEHCFQRSPLFSLLNPEELAIINEARMEVTFKAGEILYKQGTPLTHIVIINSGLGKIYLENASQKNLILNYTKPYHLNGGVGVFIDRRHHSSLKAVTDCDACFIEIGIFWEVLKLNAAFMEACFKEFAESVKHTYHQFAVLTQKNMEGRIAESLLYLSEVILGNNEIEHISKQDLAELTAMTKESTIRVLKDFNENSIIDSSNKRLIILDKKALKQIAHYG